MSSTIFDYDIFEHRHNAPSEKETALMLKSIGVNSLDTLIYETIPPAIRLKNELNLAPALSEYEYIDYLKKLASKNKVYKSYIGMGYHPTVTPPVIQRNILENPGWYTQYTPYQAEIAQGRLEALINFQTVVTDLTGLPIANASLLDEGTAAAEAMQMLYAYSRTSNKDATAFFVCEDLFPQTKSVLVTRAEPLGIKIVEGKLEDATKTENLFGIIFGYPDGYGQISDVESVLTELKARGIYSVAAADLLSLTLLKPPGEFGADVVVGSSQRFGVPMGYGGPHAAFFATKDEFKRLLPGRIIGVSVDAQGNPAYRMALQTREQHIRREKATSNICTAQVLLAVMAGMYAVYHGPERLRKIGLKVHTLAAEFNKETVSMGYRQLNTDFFDTLRFSVTENEANTLMRETTANEINIRRIDSATIGVSFNETTTALDFYTLLNVFAGVKSKSVIKKEKTDFISTIAFTEKYIRTSKYLTHPVFENYHSEHEFLRYVKQLENKDLSLTTSMIPLGSCTMKLNASAEMLALTYDGFSAIHPFAPENQTEGYTELISKLAAALSEITGFSGVSLQPNSGAQGEYAGLMVIRQYHISKGDNKRNVVLIPSSAHGTNPASAVMAGMKVVVVECDEKGNINVADLKKKAELHSQFLSALMVTYPSTHGVFEESIMEVCDIVHSYGGLVYMDGANMNAQVGLTSPAAIGADVCHLNLHKTFAIPHGGGGPGMGPICVNDLLKPFLPGHAIIKTGGSSAISSVSSAPYGSASILIISLGYILMLGKNGVTNATKFAILNANYIKSRLESFYKVLYTGKNGRAAHELIFDMRDFKRTAGVEVEDIAKRLMDYGFHAPTVSFPVAGTIMVEPTESESKLELDRFCDAMISIRQEIAEIETGKFTQTENVLKSAPHTQSVVLSENWNKPYSREKAVFPLPFVKNKKFWPSVGRVNNAHGDRNLICTCPDVSEYMQETVES